MAIEFKDGPSQALSALDGMPVERKPSRVEDKAVWPQPRAPHGRPRGIQPGDVAYLPLRRAQARLREIQASLDAMRQRQQASVPASHPTVVVRNYFMPSLLVALSASNQASDGQQCTGHHSAES